MVIMKAIRQTDRLVQSLMHDILCARLPEGTALPGDDQLSAQFHKRFEQELAANPGLTQAPHYQQALVHLLLTETSCFRYWGQGTWTDYAREIHRRGEFWLNQDSTSL